MLKPGRFNMLHTSIEVLAKQNKLRPRTQQSQRRDGLPVLRKREPLKAVRTPFTNEVFYPWPEEEELRPETPFVKTRLQRQVLGSGGSRSNVLSETADLFGSNGMYKRSIGFESPTLILRRANSREKNRCGTPLPLDQPLTKLCWNNGLEEEFSDLSDIDVQPVKHSERSRRPISSGRKRDVNDITLSDLELDDTFPPKTPDVVNLTQKVLNHYFPKKMSSTQRIFRWLADCEEKSSGSTLPAHLPNITVTSRPHLQSPQLETM
ncbi:uncharacterized protein LOC128181009 [Crassostrea angulata]|uniref:uncharacterized protein LOC128181009 n=1 Tax=Magallana angulata TaxID=2784310 RepID=UPI0022B1CD8D|nr:uncharacterized protein LOC128181009 [Crassostrea angulata]